MEYIFTHWSDLNLIDRAWFVVGGWLLVLFISMFLYKGIKALKRGRKGPKVNPNR